MRSALARRLGQPIKRDQETFWEGPPIQGRRAHQAIDRERFAMKNGSPPQPTDPLSIHAQSFLTAIERE